MSTAKLYSPTTIGAIEVANRIAFAPCTRCRSDNETHLATPIMAEYYAQRASAGLLIAECTMVMPNTSAFHSEPGIYSDAHVESWRATTEAVHKAGGRIVLQIWHAGRACPAEYNSGQQPVSASAVAIPHRYNSCVQGTQVPHDTPRALTDDEVKDVVKAYAKGAANAIAAGFDGVELHGANGYLINQFLSPKCNQRTKEESHYSCETIETRARFLLEVVDACTAAIGADRVGIRLSPHVTTHECEWANPETDIEYVATELDKRKIAFIHVERRDINRFAVNRDLTIDDTPAFRRYFKHGALFSNAEYEREEAERAVEGGVCDMIAFGRLLLANPDLVRRFKEKRPERNATDMSTWYGFHVSAPLGAKGYTDYPFLA